VARPNTGSNFVAAGFQSDPGVGRPERRNLSVNGMREANNDSCQWSGRAGSRFRRAPAVIPNLDSIAEFRIITNNFDAEYGNYSGGQINVITKSGSNGYHGDLFEFLRNTTWMAEIFRSDAGSVPPEPIWRHLRRAH